jgi:hypothetical protein
MAYCTHGLLQGERSLQCLDWVMHAVKSSLRATHAPAPYWCWFSACVVFPACVIAEQFPSRLLACARVLVLSSLMPNRPAALRRALWGDYAFSAKDKRVVALKGGDGRAKCMFVQFILEPLWKVPGHDGYYSSSTNLFLCWSLNPLTSQSVNYSSPDCSCMHACIHALKRSCCV